MSGPRNIAGPVVRGPDLWGRDEELDYLWHLLTRGSVLLTGPRRHGKSSLMYGILDHPRSGFSVILLDVEWIETPEEFLTVMAAELLATDRVRRVLTTIETAGSAFTRWISKVVDEVGVGLGNIGELKIRLRQTLDGSYGWPELAEHMLRALQNLPERVVLILDEFPIMVANMLDREPATALRFLRWFRTFRQSPGTEKLTFLLGGSTNIEPRLEALKTESVLGDLQRFRIMPFPGNTAVSFVKELLLQEKTECESGVSEEIVRVCRSGVPYYLQTIVAECLADTRRTGRILQVSEIHHIYEEQVIGPVNRHRFSHYHTRLQSHYGDLEQPARIILAKLCHGPINLEGLQTAISLAGFQADILDPIIVRLEGDYYILRDGNTFIFSDGLLRDWWTRNSTPPKVKS